MKEALEYKILVVNNNDDFYLTIKKYLKLTKPVSFKDNNNQIVNYIDNGSYLVEVTPKNIRLRKVILNNKDREKAARR